jgi:cysteinyl-tRNA synthetase
VWMHNGMLNVDGEKMSKSLGNFLTVQDVLQKGHWAGEAFRLLLLKTHYRQPIDFSWAALEEARRELDRFYRALERLDGLHAEAGATLPALEAAQDALADDLNTPLAVSQLHALSDLAFEPDRLPSGATAENLLAAIRDLAGLLGVLPRAPAAWFHAGDDQAEIDTLVAARLAARKARDFAEADRIRDVLKDRGITLEDSASGTIWRRAG